MGIVIKNYNNETIFEIAPSAKILKHTITNWLSRKNEIYELNWKGESKDTTLNNGIFDVISHLDNLVTLSFINTQFSKKTASKLFAAIPKNIKSLVLDGCFKESVQIEELGAKIKAGTFPQIKSIQITHCHITKETLNVLVRQILEQKTISSITIGIDSEESKILTNDEIAKLLGTVQGPKFNEIENHQILYEKTKNELTGELPEAAADL